MFAPAQPIFMPGNLPDGGLQLAQQVTFAQRFANPGIARIDGMPEAGDIEAILRGDFQGDANKVLAEALKSMVDLSRGITSGMTAFPVRENLEAEAKVLVPLNTPFRNMCPRVPGAGKASAWKQLTSLGGGYGAKGTTTSSGNSSGGATITLTANAAPLGFRVGDEVTVGTETVNYYITAISSATITLNANLAANQNSAAVTKVNISDGGVGVKQIFFAEDGAPGSGTSVYVDKSATYRLIGLLGSITGFAMASGANFQPQYETERNNSLQNVMLLEEYALINSVASDTNLPWGDGTTALGYDGLIASIGSGRTTASSGAMTLAKFAKPFEYQWRALGPGCQPWVMMSASEKLSLNNLVTPTSTVLRVTGEAINGMAAGIDVTHIIHPISGEKVPVIVNPFMPKGTVVYGANRLPDGKSAYDVDVLPQIALPDGGLYTNGIQGYTVQEIANTSTAPQVFPWLTSVYEVFRMKADIAFWKLTGCLPNA